MTVAEVVEWMIKGYDLDSLAQHFGMTENEFVAQIQAGEPKEGYQ